MAYQGHRGSFDPAHDALAATPDPCDASVVAEVRTIVLTLLASRPREELDGEGALRRDFAFERIAGSLEDLRALRRRAVKVGALPAFLELIDAVITEAVAARDAAPRAAQTPAAAGRRPADWATAPLDNDWAALPDFLRDL